QADPPPARGRAPACRSASCTRVFGLGRGGQPHRMAELNPLRYLARAAPKPLDGALAMAANVTSDFASLPKGLRGNDLDEWNPEYLARPLPLMLTVFLRY